MKNSITLLIAGFLVALVALVGCDREFDTRPIPSDENPAIAIEPPSSGRFKSRLGEQVVVNLRMADNEALRLLRVMRTIFDETGVPVISDDFYQDIDISGQVVTQDFSYNVAPIANTSTGPVTVENFFKVRLSFFAIDTKGASDSISVLIDIVPPDDNSIPLYKLDSYEGIIMNNPDKVNIPNFPCPDEKSGPKGEANYSLSLNRHLGVSPNELDTELAIVSRSPFNSRFSAIFTSPANDVRGIDSVFAYTDETRFNYDAATYTTLSEAFKSSAAYYSLTDSLTPGRIVLMRLPRPTGIPDVYHLAALRIKAVRDSLGGECDFLEFDYKVSFER
ncbi:MAG: hypothetical protein AAGI38_20890 [Bacteroidota bacterium]